jgi:transposase-like protein
MATKRKYPAELKLEVVKQCLEGNKAVSQVASENDVSDNCVYRWLAAYREQGESAFEPKSRAGRLIKDPTKIPPVLYKELGLDKIRKDPKELKNALTENEKLKLIIAEKELEIRMLRDLLKKTNKGR